MRSLLGLALSVLLVAPTIARAAPMHMDRKVTKTATGARITFMLRSDSSTHPGAYVGVHAPATVEANNNTFDLRMNLQRVNETQSPQRFDTPVGQALPAVLELNYGRHGLASGQTVRLVSTWPYANAKSQVHVWGQSAGDDFQLP